MAEVTTTTLRKRTRPVSTLAETLEILRAHETAIRTLGATTMFVYGSAARDQLDPDSDVDLFIDYDPAGPFSFVELFDLRDLASEKLGRRVDMTTRRGLHPKLRSRIEARAVQVF